MTRIDPFKHLAALRERSEALRREHPVATTRALRAAAVVSALMALASVWFVVSLLRELPSRAEVERIGEMDQATAVYDRERPARLHDLQGTAHRRAARRRCRRLSSRRSSRSRISGSTITTASI